MTSALKIYKGETGMKRKSIFSPAEADREICSDLVYGGVEAGD
jgi:hypothetical protein